MHIKKLITALMLSLPLHGCIDTNEKVYKSTYAWGPEVHSFTPCTEEKGTEKKGTEKKDYWVSFDWAGIAMHSFYKKAAKKPYQLMYLEFRGQVLNEKVDGFADAYSGLIRISEVHKFTMELPTYCR